MSIADTLNNMEAMRVRRQYEEGLQQEAQDAKMREEERLTHFGSLEQQPSTGESVSAAFANTPVVRSVRNIYNTMFMDRDPEFDPVFHTVNAINTGALDPNESDRLFDTNSKEEFDYMLNEIREQQNNQLLASSSLSGQVANFVAQQGSMENLLFTVGTAGVGYYGVVAKSAKAGMLANQFRGAVTGGATSYVGAHIDADNMVGFSQEDIGWATLIGSVAGGAYGSFTGRVYEPRPAESGIKLYDAGALADSAKRMYERAIGKGFKQYRDLHAAKAADSAELKEAIATNRTGIFREEIDDMDFNLINDTEVDLDAAVDDWNLRNQMDERLANKTKAEQYYDKFEPLQSDSAKFAASKSPLAKVLGTNLFETGTGSVVKNNSASIVMERLQQVSSNMYVPEFRNHFQAYHNRVVGEAGGGMYERMTKYFHNRAKFNEETVLYMNARRAGRNMDNVSPEVKALADKLDEGNRFIYEEARRAGVDGFDEIIYKNGFLHQRHERDFYMRARTKYGAETLHTVIQKALMSPRGAGITDQAKAMKMAKAYVQRFTDKPSDLRAGSVLEDDAWEMMREVFETEGFDFEGKDLKKLFKDVVGRQATEKGKARYAKDRIPLDLEVEHNGLRMMDLINTDVEHLTSSYAMSMSGHIALAQKGITGKHTWNKIKRKILEQDPQLEQSLDDMYNTFSTGRTGGGVNDRRIALAMKATVLGLLNNLGLTQLTESGTSMAAYGIRNFFSQGTEAIQSMFKGKTSVAATNLANEISDSWFPLGKEHIAMPPHLAQELQSNSRLATTSMMDKMETAVNMGLTMQGYTSLFNPVRSAQHHIVFGGLVHKIGRYINDGRMMDEQLASLGFSERLFDQVKDSIRAHGKLNNGKVDMLGFDKWDMDTKDAFINIIVRNQSSIVQKAMAGESSAWMSKDYGALLTQLRKFPLESVRKQLIRKGSIGMDHLALSALYNTIVAGTVITAMNYLKGNSTEKDFEEALRFGAVYNADLGSVASLWDLGISLTGASDSLHINPWARYGDGLFAIPALSVANSWLHIPSAIASYTIPTLGVDADERRAGRMLPIVGNHAAIMGIMQATGIKD